MIRSRFLAVFMALFFLAGCTGLTPTQQRTLTGGALGAAAGAGVSALSGGNPTTGAVVGGAGGAATGYLLGRQR